MTPETSHPETGHSAVIPHPCSPTPSPEEYR